MNARRIDLADPSADADAIADALRAHGFEVVLRTIESIREGPTADLVIVAADAPDGLAALDAIREREPSYATPVILVGGPHGEPFDLEIALDRGADAHYPRPVPLDRLVRKIETFLAPDDNRLLVPSDTGAEPISRLVRISGQEISEIIRLPLHGAPERTMRLPDEEVDASEVADLAMEPALAGDVEGESELPLEMPAREHTVELDEAGAIVGSQPTPASGGGTETSSPNVSSPAVAEPERAEVSERLAEALLAADRRVFPTSPPLELRIRASHEPPESLVPAELLEPAAAHDVLDDDAFDQFTSVGPGAGARDSFVLPPFTPGPPPSNPPPSQVGAPASGGSVATTGSGSASVSDVGVTFVGRPSSSPPPPASVHPSTRSEAQTFRSGRPPLSVHGDSVRPVPALGIGEPTERGLGRFGDLVEAGLLALIGHVVERRLDAELRLEVVSRSRAFSLVMILVGGELRALRGPLSAFALDALVDARRLADRAADEPSAASILTRAVDANLVTRFEVDRELARAAERALHEAAIASSARFVIEPLAAQAIDQARSAAPVLRAPLLETLLEGLRRRVDAAQARALLGRGAITFALAPDANARLSELHVEPELAALLSRSEGAPLDEVLEGAAPAVGLPGLVFALATLGIVMLRASPPRRPSIEHVVRSLRDSVERFDDLVHDADYFAILGLEREASARDVEAAWQARRNELESLALEAHALDELVSRRDEALDVLDEARDVLTSERLRARYKAALDLLDRPGAPEKGRDRTAPA